jgi:hypothetical protein
VVLLKTDVEAAEAALIKAEQRLIAFGAERGELAGRLVGEVEYDAHVALQQQIAIADQKIAAAEAARDHASKRLADAKVAAAQAEGDRRHATAKRLAKQGEKLVLDVAAKSEALAEALAALEANRTVVAAANELRGERPFIADGERKIREQPAREIPADVRHEMSWVDPDGNRPSQLRANGAGQLVPADHRGNYTYRQVEVVQSPARREPARMPKRLADEVRLVDLQGRQLWPPRK